MSARSATRFNVVLLVVLAAVLPDVGGVTFLSQVSHSFQDAGHGHQEDLRSVTAGGPDEPINGTQERHHFWDPDTEYATRSEVAACAAVLFTAGLLCSAGGIGGGGVYVMILMFAGKLSPRNAIPLSKAIVFVGSISTMLLNSMRANKKSGAVTQKAQLVDYSICRIVVPASLMGTLLGVVLNRNAKDEVIIVCLFLLLTFMSFMTIRQTFKQRSKEQQEARAAGAANGDGAQEEAAEQRGEQQAEQPAANAAEQPAEQAAEQPAAPNGDATPAAAGATDGTENFGDPVIPPEGEAAAEGGRRASLLNLAPRMSAGFLLVMEKKFTLHATDVIGVLFMLCVVIYSGVLRYHASTCSKALKFDINHAAADQRDGDLINENCRHPATSFLLGHRFEVWMETEQQRNFIMISSMVVPLTLCCAATCYSGCVNVKHCRWTKKGVVTYQFMGVLAGILAGLMGIGGGLVYSPFFLLMNVDPVVAVATSSTCVLFTSCSTSFQYLLTDRIILSLTGVYGLTNFVASSIGTVFIHHLTDKYGAKKSYITGIVALGVVLSAVLSLVKLQKHLNLNLNPLMPGV